MDVRTLGIALVVVVLAWSGVMAVAKRMLSERLERSFNAGQFDACKCLLDGPLARVALPAYNRQYMCLNVLEAQMDAEGATAVIEDMLRMRCTPQQRLALLARAFSFYSSQGDRERAAHALELIESNGDKDLLRSCRQKFEIIFDKKWSHISEMEHRLPKAGPEERAELNYLLSLQYENKGDKARADEYLKRSLKDFGLNEEN